MMLFEQWGEFYLMAGGAAAVLIGLIFVVVTLMHDRPRSSVLAGSKLYMGPVLLHVSMVLILSAAALTPVITAREIAVIAGVLALYAAVRGLWSTVGIGRLKDEVHWTDVWFYGVIPTLLSLALAGVAAGFWTGSAWSTRGVAVVITGLLLLSIRNEWDLVTWLAPKADTAEGE